MSTNPNDVTIDPPPLSNEPSDIVDWAHQSLSNLAFQLNNGIPRVRLATTAVVPDKPRDGTIAFADGTLWDPGNGEGFYGYYNGLWTALSALTGGKMLGCQKLTAASGTWTPTVGTRSSIVFLQAAGGGGGGVGATAGQGEGGQGGAGETRLYIYGAAPIAYTIGAAGGGGAAGNNAGGTAGDTSLGTGSIINAKGGTGGSGTAGNTLAANGSTPAGIGGIVLPPTSNPASSFAGGGPRGASTIFGQANVPYSGLAVIINAGTGTVQGLNGEGYGAGGSGAFKQGGTTTGSAGAGAPGMILTLEWS